MSVSYKFLSLYATYFQNVGDHGCYQVSLFFSQLKEMICIKTVLHSSEKKLEHVLG